MVLWLFSSPWLAASRQRPFTGSNRRQTSLSFLQALSSSVPTPPPSKHPKNTLNLVRGIIEEANNEGVKKEEGVSSDPQKTLSNKTGTLRA